MTAKPAKGVYISREGGRLLIRRREFSPSAAALLIFATIWNSFLLYMLKDVRPPFNWMISVPLFLLLVGTGMYAIVLYSFFGKEELSVTGTRLRKFLGVGRLGFSRNISTEDVRSIMVRPVEYRHRTGYFLTVLLNNGAEKTLLRTWDREFAELCLDELQRYLPLLKPGPKQQPGSYRAIFLMVGMIFLVWGIFGGAISLIPVWRNFSAQSWREIPCTVLTSQLAGRRPSGKGPQSWKIAVTYRYQVNGTLYIGNRYHFGSESGSRAAALRLIRELRPGTRTTCRVNPHRPSESVLRLTSRKNYWFLLISVPAIAAGVALLIFAKPGQATPVLKGR